MTQLANYDIDPQVILVPVDQIRTDLHIRNIRTRFDDTSIRELAESIYEDGLLNPIVITEADDAEGNPCLILVCGARRLRAFQYILNNVDNTFCDGEIKCTSYTGTLEDAALLNGMENIERENVPELDTCEWLLRMVEENGHTQEYMAKRMHRSVQWVSSRITISRKGTDKLKDALQEGLISVTAAYELAKSLSAEEQDKRIDRARKNAEKLTAEEAAIEKDPSRVKKPGKKYLSDMLSKAERSAANPAKRHAHGVAMALRYALGLATGEEVELTLADEADHTKDHVAEEAVEPEPEPEPQKSRRRKKGGE